MSKKRLAFMLLALVVFCSGGVLYPRETKAVNYKASDITVTLTTYVQDSNGNWVKDNLIRLVKGTQSIVVKVGMTLTAPSSGLVLGTDTVDMNTGGLTLTGLGAGVDKKGDGDSAGGISCSDSTIRPLDTSSTAKYTSCDFDGANSFYDITIPANQEKELYLNNPQTSFASGAGTKIDTNNTTTPQTLIVYPFINFNRGIIARNRTLIFPTGGSTLYVLFYDNQTALKAAETSNNRGGVAAYGGPTSSSGSSTDTGSFLVGLLNKVIAFVLQIITELLYFLFYWLVAPLIQALLSIHTYSDAFINVIYPGWEVVRNVSNIFLIIALITIAVATLFRLEGYQFRHLLVELVIAALLVNFSLIICQAILGFFDTLRSQFLPNNVEVIRSLARDLMVSNIRNVIYNSNFSSFGEFSTTVSLLFYVSMSVGSFGVFCAIAGYLVICVGMTWIIVMLFPAGIVSRILPSTKSIGDKLTSELVHYGAAIASMAFFLNLTAVMSSTMNKENGVLSVISENTFKDSNSPNLTVFVFKVGSNIMMLVFLVVALKVADQLGIYGASAVNSVVEKGMWAPFKIAGKPIQWGSEAAVNKFQRVKMEQSSKLIKPHEDRPWWNLKRNAGRAAFAILNPGAVGKAIKERGEERMHASEHLADSSASMALQQFWGEKTMDERTEATLHGALQQKKKFESLAGERANLDNLEQLTTNLDFNKDKTKAAPDEVDKQRWMGQFLKLVDEKGLNEILKQASRFGSSNKDGYSASAEGLSAFLNEMKDKGVLTDGEAGHLLTQINDVAYKNKEYWYAENFNTHAGHPVAFEMETATDASGKKVFTENVAGKTQYDKVMAEVESKMASTGNTEIENYINGIKLSRGVADLPADEEKFLRKTKADELKARYKKDAAQDPSILTDDHEKHLYGNYDTYLLSQLERYTNYKKAPSQADAREGHYTRFNRMKDDGSSQFNDMGISFIAGFDETRAKQSTEWNPQTTAASSKSFYADPEGNIEKVKEEIAKNEHQGSEYSGTKAVLRMNAFKDIFLTKRVDKDDQRKLYINEIDRISTRVQEEARAGRTVDEALIKTIMDENAKSKTFWDGTFPGSEKDELAKQVVANL